MTRPSRADRPPEQLADTRRRIRSATWLAAGAATAASAVFGILFSQPDPAAAEPVPLPSFAPADPSIAPVPAPASHPSTARRKHTHPAASPLRPPAQPPRPATGPGRATSGAS